MNKFAAVGFLAFVIATSGAAQDFNARQGYIFNQKFVSRISTAAASKLSGVADVDGEFFALYDKLGKARDSVKPDGVKRVGDTLVLEAVGKPKLSLTDFNYKGKDDAGDSQRFSYLKESDRFHILSVSFDHDRPCFMLVDKGTLQVYFIDYEND